MVGAGTKDVERGAELAAGAEYATGAGAAFTAGKPAEYAICGAGAATTDACAAVIAPVVVYAGAL